MEDTKALSIGSIAGGIVATVITHPVDVIKTCMQGDVEQSKYTNIRGTKQALIDQYGVRAGLFKALSWRTSQIICTFFLVNYFKQALAPICFPSITKGQ